MERDVPVSYCGSCGEPGDGRFCRMCGAPTMSAPAVAGTSGGYVNPPAWPEAQNDQQAHYPAYTGQSAAEATQVVPTTPQPPGYDQQAHYPAYTGQSAAEA